ncbi:MAG TPA: hypothetical protein VHV83_00785 [Armatimonadota bacterium]|nr:hypothetical protein [Armatimonadota bacterium]
MRAFFWTLLVMMICIIAMPVVAQQANDPPPRPRADGNRPKQLIGRMVEVKNDHARLALYVKVDTPDVPGKIPDQMAARAASLENLANQLERKGNMDAAQRNRNLAYELRCWREVEASIGQNVPVVGVSRASIDGAQTGTHIAMEVSVQGVADVANFPDHATLMNDARQVAPRIKNYLVLLGRGAQDSKTFFRLVGDLSSVNPLTMTVNGKDIIIDNPRNFEYWQVTPMKMQDVNVNQRIVARVRQTDDGLAIGQVMHVIVTETDSPLDIGDIF